ncbi:MAG: alpha/beta hydrolase [Actinomycetota bacterium]|nr:alpha/beta hydrolase [Actinomycetota bacterium]
MQVELLELDTGAIAHRTSSGHGRPIVFVHGNSASGATWRNQLGGPIGLRYRSIALDLPGHGDSPPPNDLATYSAAGYAAVLADAVHHLHADGPVLVGWSLGGHIALEAAADIAGLAGIVIFGTPPLGRPPAMDEAFLANPAMEVGFTAEVDADAARRYATAQVAPGSELSLDAAVEDILRTDGRARAGLAATVAEGGMADELAIVKGLDVPLAVLTGAEEQLVNRAYLEALDAPSLWHGKVHVIDGAGHAPHLEQPDVFDAILDNFMEEL